jgi:hypothetical protein
LGDLNLPRSYLPTLRSRLTAVWPRILALIEMISIVIHNEIKRITREKAITNEQDYLRLVLEQFNLAFGDNQEFWYESVKAKLKARFPGSLSDIEGSKDYDLRKSNLGLFQLARSLQNHTGVELTRDAELNIIKNESIVLVGADIKRLNFFPERESVTKGEDSKGELQPTTVYKSLVNILRGFLFVKRSNPFTRICKQISQRFVP